MTGPDDSLSSPFRRLLADLCTPDLLRAGSDDGVISDAWRSIQASGYLDAMVPESDGGVGLSQQDVFPLVVLAGEYLLPLPFAETMLARALIGPCQSGVVQNSAIAIGRAHTSIGQPIGATHALVQCGAEFRLVPISDRAADGDPLLVAPSNGIDLTVIAAALSAANMSGMMLRVMAMCLDYANNRNQFGRPLGKFQVIQHNLAIMAEQVASAQVAARIGFSGSCFAANRVAVAKIRTSEAAAVICTHAHALFGAIGMTAEFDLHLYTQQLQRQRMANGSEAYWAELLGLSCAESDLETSMDFARLELQEG